MFRWFERRLPPYPMDAPTLPPQSLLGFCLYYSRGAWPWLLLMALGSVIFAVIEIWLFGEAGKLVDKMATHGPTAFWQAEGSWLILVAVVVLFVLPAIDLVSEMVMHQTLIGNFPQRIRWQAHRYLLRQSMSYFQDEFSGRIATKLMQTSLAVREVVMKILDVLVYVLAYFIGAIVLAMSNDWRLALPFVLFGLLYGALLWRLIPVLGHISQEQADARSVMTGRIVDSYTNIATVKLFSHARREETYVQEGMHGFLTTVYRQMRLVTVLNVCLRLLNSALLAGVAGVGVWLWVNGHVDIGAVAAAVPLAMRFNGMAHWIMWEMSSLFENIGTVRDGIGSLALPRTVDDAPNATVLHPGPGEVRFQDVTFRYGADAGSRGAVLDNLNLTIAPGERVGLVGRSGAGKSTLVNLLLRFHDLESGRITIDGQDVSQVTQESLRAAIGMVTQDSALLHRSVRDNIAYGKPDADEAQIMDAARMAEAHEFIPTLSDSRSRRGLDAHVGERGVKLSGGQRQRIAIARVALKDAPILILDEATSALDSEVEAAIQSRLDALMEGKTVIAIAHRLSTIAAMDRLIVMDGGQIVEQGTHDELLQQGGLYARLWSRQSGGFLAPDTNDPDVAE
ncbi:MAG: ABC transporter ATP-binding protein [Paracoccus sp. (in: a-proteobacteria)]|uniref:ABC transporter ATP-binding protein n=1 Tax=Paracoccus sp. TaxID=267 RepID=UPI0026DFF75B|nr:ABC transporter ATP-binding protein [Paracoccus sp. (in: a-proteobacteria)]MDO5632778.1 ABC transporter ATP-binding protein [Paracoccus sp. (in: a-proteobacteria)]